MKRRVKTNQISKGSTKNLDNLKLFLGDPKIQAKIGAVRNYLEIPPELYDQDYSGDKDVLIKEWGQKKIRELDEIMDGEQYKQTVNNIRNAIFRKEIDLKMAQRQDKILSDSKIYSIYLDTEINNMVKEHSLPENYKRGIEHYIFFGDIRVSPTLPFSLGYGKDIKDQNIITVKIYRKLTDKDLVELKKYVNKYLGENLPPIIKPIKNLDGKIAVERLFINRYRVDEVEQKDYKLSAKEIAQEANDETGGKIKEHEIYDIPRQLKNLRKKRFGKSGTK